MIKKPNLPSLKLWELAKEWNKKFKGCDISVDDILRYGINGDLTIYAEIPKSCEIEEATFMDKEDYQRKYPDRTNRLSDTNFSTIVRKEGKVCVGIEAYSGHYLEPLQKKDLQIIYLEGAAKLIELQDPRNPNRFLWNSKSSPFNDNYIEPLPSLTGKNLCVLREDITAFEEKYFLTEEMANSTDETNVISAEITQPANKTAMHNNSVHDSFAPELAIASEIWNYLYVENKIKKGKNIKSQVTSWLKNNKDKYAKYFLHAKDKDFPSQELCKRLSTVITPQARKGGGIESIE